MGSVLTAVRPLWRVPLARIFGAGSSSDTGWDFERFDKPGLFVGSVGYPPLKLTSTYGIFDLSREMTAGFRISDGGVVWRNRGALFVCGILPCPGFPLNVNPDPAGSSAAREVVGLRLRMRGSVKATYAGSISMSPDATATIEGFEPAPARTTVSRSPLGGGVAGGSSTTRPSRMRPPGSS